MKFILERAKKVNLLFIFMLGIFIYTLFFNFTNYDNDLWFILATGRNILTNGISHFDTLSMHSDYAIVTQQWLTSIIYYFIANRFGAAVFSTFISIITFLGVVVLYKYSKFLTKNTSISSLLTILYIYFFVRGYATTRPQIITYLILTLELFITDKFIKTRNKKLLIILPILSILEINLHSSMWFLQFCFIGVYFLEFINKKSIRTPLFITLVLMLFGGLINPYRIDAITYVFKSYGIKVINDIIVEMQPVTVNTLIGKQILVSLFLVLFVSTFYKKIKLRYLLLLGGTSYLALSHVKSVPYFGIAFIIAMSSMLYDVNLKEIYLNYVKSIKFKRIKNILTKASDLSFKYTKLALVVTTLMLVIESYSVVITQADFSYPLEMVVDYLDATEENKDITIYTSYVDGSYLEYRGYKPYIDPRGDVFIKSTNKKFDLMKEYVDVKNGKNVNLFLDKYGFDYILVDSVEVNSIYKYLTEENKNDYKVVYRLYGERPAVLFKRVN